MGIRKWTAEEIALLRRLRAEGKDINECAKELGRSRDAIDHKLYDKNEHRCPKGTGRRIDEKSVEWLVKHYEHTSNAELCGKLGICEVTLHRYARKLGLKKSGEYLQKTQDTAQKAAAASHRANGTYPPKGVRNPNLTYTFSKGVSPSERHGEKRWAQMREKARKTWANTRKRDYARFLYGFEQKTKFRFVKQGRSKVNFRYGLRKLGYVEDSTDHNLYYYTDETIRRQKKEANAAKHGIRIQRMLQTTP